MIKVIGGTRPTSHLCGSCVHGMCMGGLTESNDRYHCHVTERPINSVVTECTSYGRKEIVKTPKEMIDQAWIVGNNSQGETVITPPNTHPWTYVKPRDPNRHAGLPKSFEEVPMRKRVAE
jgi:hypothetical protein